MRRVSILTLLSLALPGCYTLFPQPSERVNPRVARVGMDTIAVIAGGDGAAEVQVAQRAREQVRGHDALTVVSVSGLWSTEREAVAALCGPAQVPPLDGLVVVESDNLRLWDCPTGQVAFEARGGWQGVRHLGDRLLAYLDGKP